MTNETLTESSATVTPAVVPPPPKRKSSRLVIIVLVAAFFLLALPAALVAFGVFWFLTPGVPIKNLEGQVGETPSVKALESGDVPVAAPQRKDDHPLDPALKIAYDGLNHMRKDVRDYTANITKRERVGGKLGDEETMFAKIQSRRVEDGKTVVPLGVYLKFLDPKSKAGRQVIFVEGQNNDKLVVHEPFFPLNLARYYLRVNGPLAMGGERYPITDIGVDFLVEELIKRGEKDRELDRQSGKISVEVKIEKGLDFVGRKCTRIEVRHPKKTPEADFLMAEIYLDEELFVPLRYAAYSWPEVEGDEMVLEEEYTYKDMKVNVGLTNIDFDPDNPEYKFPKQVGS